jgi:hypothetical protein
VLGALLLSFPRFARVPQAAPPTLPPGGEPQATQSPYDSPPAITLQGQQPPQKTGQPGSPAQPLPRASDVVLSFSASGQPPGQPITVTPDGNMLTISLT